MTLLIVSGRNPPPPIDPENEIPRGNERGRPEAASRDGRPVDDR
jgi:hypothetical protein